MKTDSLETLSGFRMPAGRRPGYRRPAGHQLESLLAEDSGDGWGEWMTVQNFLQVFGNRLP